MKRWKIVVICIFGMIVSLDAQASLEVDLDRIVVTATRINQEQYKVAGNVAVITKEQIAESNASNVTDIIADVVGVNVYESGTAKSRTIDIRGFGDTAARNVLIMVNGRKINNVDIAGPELMQVPLGAIERIEVLRGGGSVLYGDNAVGGVVNIITKEGEGKLSGKAGYKYGSYDRQEEDLEISGSKKGLSYYIYSKYADDRGYRENSDVLTRDFNGRLGYELNEHLKLDVNVGWHKDGVGLPGGLSQAELETLGRRETTTPNDFADTKDQFVRVTTEITPWTKKDYLGDLVVDYYFRDRDVSDFVDTSFGAFTSTRDTITKAITAKYIFDHTFFDQEVDFVTGYDYANSKNDIRTSGPFGDDALTIHKDEFGVFGYLEFEAIDNLFVNAGKRYQKAEYTFDQPSASTFEQQSPDEKVAMGGLKYRYAKGSNVYFNFQQSFRFLATDEWYSSFSGLNTDLEQQSGEQYELGIKHNFNDKLISSLNWYLINLNNEIFFDPKQGAFGENSNYDKTRRVGIEFGNKFDLLKLADLKGMDKLDFSLNYTFQQPEFRDGNFDGNGIPMVPRHQASYGMMAGFFKNYSVSINGRYVGSRYAINDPLNAVPRLKPHHVLDGKISFKSKNLEIYGAINNIFDAQYHTLSVKSSSSDAIDYFPAPEKNYNFGVKLKY